MNRIQTITVAVLVAALPLAPAASASDWGHNDRGHERAEHGRGHDYGHDRHEYREHHYGHHNQHYYRHDHHGYYQNSGQYYGGQRAQVVLPFPPLPPFPVIVLNKKHSGGHVELRRPY